MRENTTPSSSIPLSHAADPITALINQLATLPGIGEKTASRLAFFILRSPADYAQALSEAIVRVKEKICLCEVCCNLTEQTPCALCRNGRRDTSIICVVESPQDVQAIEVTGEYRGTYHVLHGVIKPLDGIGPDELKFRELFDRLSDDSVEEVIAATNPSVEGEATALYLKRLLGPLGIKVTRIARGLPMGSNLEYADRVTLGRSIADRCLI